MTDVPSALIAADQHLKALQREIADRLVGQLVPAVAEGRTDGAVRHEIAESTEYALARIQDAAARLDSFLGRATAEGGPGSDATAGEAPSGSTANPHGDVVAALLPAQQTSSTHRPAPTPAASTSVADALRGESAPTADSSAGTASSSAGTGGEGSSSA